MNRPKPRNAFLNVIFIFAILCAPCAAAAHEFWLEPEDFAPAPGSTLPVKAKVGQFFDGESLVFLARDFTAVAKYFRKRRIDIRATDGDSPALGVFIREAGPQLVTLASRFYVLEFTAREKFIEYLNLEGYRELAEVAARELQNPIEIWEQYERNAKLLLFGGGRRGGSDYRTGLDMEFVFDDDFSRLKVGNKVSVTLLRGGRPLADTPVKVLRYADRKKGRFVKTDAKGKIVLDLDTAGPWLINAVHFTTIEVEDGGDVKSTWASYVFSVE